MIEVDHLPTLPSLLTRSQTPLIHRDLSWLQFNERVLDEARQETNPLMERAKFLAISSTNLDEFFMIRVASIERSVANHRRKLNWSEFRRYNRARLSLLEEVAQFCASQVEVLTLLTSEMERRGIHIVRNLKDPGTAHDIGRKLFEKEILPKLPAPESFSLEKVTQLENLQSAIIFPGGQIWLRLPLNLPTMVWADAPESESGERPVYFYFVEDLLAAFLGPTVPAQWSPGFIRLTRDADYSMDLQETDPESVPDVMMSRISTRERGKPVRLQYSGELPEGFLTKSCALLKLSPGHLFPAPTTLFLHGLWNLVNNIPERFAVDGQVKYPPLKAAMPEVFESGKDIFEELKQRDFLLHHPYDSFDAYIKWIECAVKDPKVVRIEHTIYRTDALSPVIDLLKKAAKKKQVGVVIELRARFDELNNLRLADELQKAGVEVAFGFGQLKLHAKVALVTRKEGEQEVLYTHLSTGNYHAVTARAYTDMAILTSNPEIGQDARHFFDCLWKGQVPTSFKQLVIAPTKLARRLNSLIQAEAEAARAGRKARIIAKVNALVDQGIIETLYQASQAGVQVDLIVRGACSLVPGVRGLSENIRVVSVVDRFLEHSRIYYFEDAKKLYLSSADWMPRNFFSRLEIAFPILDPRIYQYLSEVVLPAYLSDTVKARELTQQGTWKKRINRTQKPPMRSQVLFRELALRNYRGTPLE